MKTPDKPNTRTADRTKHQPAEGPTSPPDTRDRPHKGPETGGYDDHSPDRTSRNEKGGYGAG